MLCSAASTRSKGWCDGRRIPFSWCTASRTQENAVPLSRVAAAPAEPTAEAHLRLGSERFRSGDPGPAAAHYAAALVLLPADTHPPKPRLAVGSGVLVKQPGGRWRPGMVSYLEGETCDVMYEDDDALSGDEEEECGVPLSRVTPTGGGGANSGGGGDGGEQKQKQVEPGAELRLNILTNLARALLRAGRGAPAADAASRALAASPAHVPALYLRACARRLAPGRDLPGAKADLEAALALGPKRPTAGQARSYFVSLSRGREAVCTNGMRVRGCCCSVPLQLTRARRRGRSCLGLTPQCQIIIDKSALQIPEALGSAAP